MTLVNRNQILRELEPGLNKIFDTASKGYENEHLAIFSVENSDRAFEEELLFTGFGAAPVKREGAGVQYDSATEGWLARYSHETIALAFAITEESDATRDLYGSRGRQPLRQVVDPPDSRSGALHGAHQTGQSRERHQQWLLVFVPGR